MVQTILFFLLVMGLAFSVGFAVRKGSICAVAAADQFMNHRRSGRLKAFIISMCAAGAAILPIAWFLPREIVLSPGYPVTVAVVIGGAVFGLGAYINGACAFGTISHLAGGDTVYSATIVGAALGGFLVPLFALEVGSPTTSTLLESNWVGYLLFVVFASISVRAAWRHRKSLFRNASRRMLPAAFYPWRPATAMLVIGISGGLLHAIAGKWTYMAVLSDRTAKLVDPILSDTHWAALVGSTALLFGGICAALMSGKFAFVPPDPSAFARKLLGGALMGLSAAIIPGGNDVLLLYGLPSLAPHAIVAYTMMMATLMSVFFMKNCISR